MESDFELLGAVHVQDEFVHKREVHRDGLSVAEDAAEELHVLHAVQVPARVGGHGQVGHGLRASDGT